LAHLPITLIPFGVDRAVFRPREKGPCRQKLGIPVDARAVGLRWAPWNVLKGTEYAVEALAKLPKGLITHVVCFDSSSAFASESLKGKYEFIYLGWIDNDMAVSTALNAVDLFVMPSIAETFGMMAIEAMACGTPVVVFENTSLPEVVDSPHAGLAVPYKDSGALAEAMQDVLVDNALRNSLIVNSLKLVAREYTLEKYFERHLKLYESLLTKRN
jgi:glycosyltransferase involved in cell wall biosynthesis